MEKVAFMAWCYVLYVQHPISIRFDRIRASHWTCFRRILHACRHAPSACHTEENEDDASRMREEGRRHIYATRGIYDIQTHAGSGL